MENSISIPHKDNKEEEERRRIIMVLIIIEPARGVEGGRDGV